MNLQNSNHYKFNISGKRILAMILAGLLFTGQSPLSPHDIWAAMESREDSALARCDEMERLPYVKDLQKLTDEELLKAWEQARAGETVATAANAQTATAANASPTGGGPVSAQPAAAGASPANASPANASPANADGTAPRYRAPDIVVEKDSELNIFYGIAGDEKGCYVGTDIWAEQDLLDLSQAGTYELAYVIADSHYNVVEEFTRTVTVTDKNSMKQATADDLWVSAEQGMDSNEGTEEKPLKTLYGAQQRINPGGTIHVMGALPENDVTACAAVTSKVRIVGEGDGAVLERGTVTQNGKDRPYEKAIFTVETGGSLALENIEISGGNTPDCAPLISVQETGSLQLGENVTLRDNSGGAIALRGQGSLEAEGNDTSVICGTGAEAPAVKLSGGGSCQMSGIRIQDNQGGALRFLQYTGRAVISQCTITGNSDTAGGAVYIAGGTGDIQFGTCTMENNAAQYGGAIAVRNSSAQIHINGVTIQNNLAAERGSAIDVTSPDCTLVIRSGTITGNGTQADASAVYVAGTAPKLELAGTVMLKDNYGSVTRTGGGGTLFTTGAESTDNNLTLDGTVTAAIIGPIKKSEIKVHHFGKEDIIQAGTVLARGADGYALSAADAAVFTLDDTVDGSRFYADLVKGVIALGQKMNDIYVKSSGDDSNVGTGSEPVKTFDKACALVEPGGTVHVVGAVETMNQVQTQKSITVVGEPDETGAGGSIHAGAALDSLIYSTQGAVVTAQNVTFSGESLTGQMLGRYDLIRVANSTFIAEAGTRITAGNRGGIGVMDKNALAVMKDGSEIDHCYGYSNMVKTTTENGERGAAVAVVAGRFQMEGGSIHDNAGGDDKKGTSSSMRGIIYGLNGARIELSGSSEITGNRASMGGAVFVHGPDAEATIRDQALIEGNVSDCGIISAEDGAVVQIEGGIIQKNIALNTIYQSGTVGAILQADGGTYRISGGTIRDNGARLERAAVDTDGKGTVALSGDAVIADNYANVTLITGADGLTTGFTKGAESRQLNLCAPSSGGLTVNVTGATATGLIRVGKTLAAGAAFASGSGYTLTEADSAAFQSDDGSTSFKVDAGSNKVVAAAGIDIYVSSAGNDGNDGRTPATPVLTWTRAIYITNKLADGPERITYHLKGEITGGILIVNSGKPDRVLVGEPDESGKPAVLKQNAANAIVQCSDGTIRIKNLCFDRSQSKAQTRVLFTLKKNGKLYLDAGAVIKGAGANAVAISDSASVCYMNEGSSITDCFSGSGVNVGPGTLIMDGGEISRCVGGTTFDELFGKLPREIYADAKWQTEANNAGAIRGGAGGRIIIRGDSKITQNVGAYGAIFVDTGGSLLIEGDPQFSRNAGYYAAAVGAVDSNTPDITVKGGTFTDNYADEAIIRSQGRLDIQGGTFTGNGVGGSEYLTFNGRGTLALSGSPIIKGNYCDATFDRRYDEAWHLTGSTCGSISSSERVLLTGAMGADAEVFLTGSEADITAAKGDESYRLTEDDAAHFQSDTPGLRIVLDLVNNRLVFQEAGDVYVSGKGNDGWEGSRSHPYRTLAAAAAGVPDGGTIHVLDEVSVGSKIWLEDLKKNMTVTGENGAGVLCPAVTADGHADGFFEVGTGRTLVLQNLTLDGKGKSLTDPLINITDGTLKLEQGTVIKNIGLPGRNGATTGYSKAGAISLSGENGVCEVGEDCRITGCYVKVEEDGTQLRGGAITMAAGTLRMYGGISDCAVSGAENGGAGLRMEDGTAYFDRGAWIRSCEGTYGSAILTTGGALYLDQTTIEDNQADTGGAIVCDALREDPIKLHMNSGIITGNHTRYSGVSAVEVGNNTVFTMLGGTITKNTADIQTYAIDGSKNHEVWDQVGGTWVKSERRISGNSIFVGGSATIRGNGSADYTGEYGSDLVLYPKEPVIQISDRTPGSMIVISAKEDPSQPPIGDLLTQCAAVKPDMSHCMSVTAEEAKTYSADGTFDGGVLALFSRSGSVNYEARKGVQLVSDLPADITLPGRVKLDRAGGKIMTDIAPGDSSSGTNLTQLMRRLDAGYEELASRARDHLIFDGWYWKNGDGEFEPFLFDRTQALAANDELYATWREKRLPTMEQDGYKVTQKVVEEPTAVQAPQMEKKLRMTIKVPNSSGESADYNPKAGKGFRTYADWEAEQKKDPKLGSGYADSHSCAVLWLGDDLTNERKEEWLYGPGGKGRTDDRELGYVNTAYANLYPVKVLNLWSEDEEYLYYDAEVTIPEREFDPEGVYHVAFMNWYGGSAGKTVTVPGTPVPVTLDTNAPRAKVGAIDISREDSRKVCLRIQLEDMPSGTGSGISQLAWSDQDAGAKGNTILDSLLRDDFDAANQELRDVKVLSTAAGSYTYEMMIPKEEAEKRTVVYLYMKDAAGNTSEAAIPVNQDQIVRVSFTSTLQMSLMRQADGDGTGLLHDVSAGGIGADQIEIRNTGSMPVKAEILRVEKKMTGANALELVEAVAMGAARNTHEVAVDLKPGRNAQLTTEQTFGEAGVFPLARCAGPTGQAVEIAEIPAQKVVGFLLEPTFWDDVPGEAAGEWEIAYRFRPQMTGETVLQGGEE